MHSIRRAPHVTRLVAIVWLLVALMLGGCATGPAKPWHQFYFDGWFDQWATTVDLLEYSYGDQYHMVHRTVRPGETTLGYGTNVNGPMPVGEFLYVKWRLRSTGDVVDQRVDLRPLLPRDMKDHGLTFVIDGRQLYVYLITPQPKRVDEPPILRTTMSRFTVTYEIFPTYTYKR